MRDAIYNQTFAADFEQQRLNADETRARAAALRLQNEQATARLQQLLPFRWLVGKVRPRYQGPPVWERGPAALHIQLQEPVRLAAGQPARPIGDWLCMASLDVESGEVRYLPEAIGELWHSDGTGGPAANYLPAPTCKKCLSAAAKYKPVPDGDPIRLGTNGKS